MFNALDLMENKTFLEKLKFGIGDGNLQYYLYNWKCPSMGAEKVCTFWAAPPPHFLAAGPGSGVGICNRSRASGLGSSLSLGPGRVPSLWWPREQGQCSPFSSRREGGRGHQALEPHGSGKVVSSLSSQLVSSLIQWDRTLGLSQDTGQSHARGLPGRESLTRGAAALAPAWPFLHQLQGSSGPGESDT